MRTRRPPQRLRPARAIRPPAARRDPWQAGASEAEAGIPKTSSVAWVEGGGAPAEWYAYSCGYDGALHHDDVVHHPAPSADLVPQNLVPVSLSCHVDDHDACEDHAPGGEHACRCPCHLSRRRRC